MPVCPIVKGGFSVQLITHSSDLKDVLSAFRNDHPAALIGFVPTMGALHSGHMKLIEQAKSKSSLVVASVFVNPTQFNDADDLSKYPRTPEQDYELLKTHGCDILYLPEVKDVYPQGTNTPYEIDFEGIDTVMEGFFRPGHFKGVAQVVERFFQLVLPDLAFFGRKDFQQVAIIKHLVRVKKIPVKIEVVETVRSNSGLALSSRNLRLSEKEREEALIIYQTLVMAKKQASANVTPGDLKNKLIQFFNSGTLQLEYLEIVNNITLQEARTFNEPCTCCIAAYCGSVRLIDNMALVPDSE